MINSTATKLEDKILEEVKLYENSFIELIHERFGIVVHVHQVHELNAIIINSCKELQQTPKEYLENLKSCNNRSPLFENLIIGITVGETYFFRDKRQINLLKTIILPKIINDKRKKNILNLRIWSAGCSTGEEIFSIAMLLQELLEDYKLWNLQLLGTDINRKSLERIEQGRYGQWSMRSISDYYKNRYFTMKGKSEYILSDEIKNMVKFQYLNLNDNMYPSLINGTNDQDLILCRNVLIYFNRKYISQIMKRLSSALSENGYLILGASDPIDITNSDLLFCDDANEIYFIKKPNNMMETGVL